MHDYGLIVSSQLDSRATTGTSFKHLQDVVGGNDGRKAVVLEELVDPWDTTKLRS